MPPLVKPSFAPVSPGNPVTAQAWNAILTAIGDLFDAVLALGTNTLDVNVGDGSAPLTDARVVAVPATGAPIVAVPPRGSGTAFTLTALPPGSWTIHVSAPGFAAAAVAQTIPASGPLAVTLTPTTKLMPDLLGMTATTALARLTSDAIQLDQILDVTGEEVSKTALPSNRVSSRVLFQFPVPGERVTAASARTRLVISAEAEAQITTMPNLVGLNYAQLLDALNKAGLKLGHITYLTK